jgi:hypothetical protein
MHSKKVWWKQCRSCGNASTGIGYTIHSRFQDWCCGEPLFKESSSLKALNKTFDYPGYWRYVQQVENAQIEYGIAWGVE